MKALSLATVAFIILNSAAFAALGPEVEALNEVRAPSDHASRLQSAAPLAPGVSVRNPNECMADRAEPVWSATSTILGYLCRSNENGA